ncbi:hypothetical protein DQ04_01471060 [Trypanosoma grayi]|uniref:hypothetical protein n=1 Tax=Trypanosoma grayi TaxID=71804 RepID=UPI0004F48C4C|nr:hypothetical protein DQ04_01471060 [Trypanosoma grayi]KEG12720.1 hypothetical protein DQ04_01471060 [Trypanosoma grayi]
MTSEAAEQHEEFLQEVGAGIDAHTSRMREGILQMLTLYLKQQQIIIRESLRAEAECRERAILDEKREVEVELNSARNDIQKQKTIIRNLVLMLGDAHQRLWWQRRFRDWVSWLLKKRQRRQLDWTLKRSGNILRTYHLYAQWRLFAAARRQQRLALAEQSQWKLREAELLAQVEALKERAEEERRRSDCLEEKMKAAFVRGVCALNKEAVQVLRGTQETEDVEEPRATPSRLFDARSTRLQSTRASHTPSTTARFDILQGQASSSAAAAAEATTPTAATGTATTAAPLGGRMIQQRQGMGRQEHQQMCPLHHVPTPGPPCHICYAPDTCTYNTRPVPHQPFVVSVDPSAVRSYGTTPASQRPPHISRTAVKTGRSRAAF